MINKRFASVAGLVFATFAAVLVTMALSDALSASKESAQTIYRVEGDVQKPVRISGDPPGYPEEERKEKIQGEVVVVTVIDQDGTVASTEVLEAETDGLAAAALAAIRDWKFEPATLDGEAVSVYYTLTIKFRLDAGDKPEKT